MLGSPLKGILVSLEDIPTIPVFVQRLLVALEEENLAAQDLERIIRRDPVISSRILRVANSSFFGLSKRVGTLERAIVVLGTRFVEALALSVSLLDTLAYNRSVGHIPWENYWLHSFACAWASNHLVRMGVFSEVKDESFVCGLLHDLGKPILWIHQAEAYQNILNRVNEEGFEIHDAEKAIFQVHHGDVGAELANWWKLPEAIQAAIRDHHDEEPSSSSAALVKVADWVANCQEYSDGLRANGGMPSLPPEMLSQVSSDILDKLADGFLGKHDEIQEVVEFLRSGVQR